MSQTQSLVVKDGNGVKKNLQVSSGSYGYITNHTFVSTVSSATVASFSTSSHNWIEGVEVASHNNDRVGVVINNDTTDIENGRCYVILGNNSFNITDNTKAPGTYSFLLEAGGLYIADASTAALKHSIYVPSSSYIVDSSSMNVLVTLIS